MFCTVLKSHKKSDTYLYKPKATLFEELPEELQQLFTPHTEVTTLHLTESRKLARMTGAELISHLNEPGYYVQIPPLQVDLLKVHKQPSKKSRSKLNVDDY